MGRNKIQHTDFGRMIRKLIDDEDIGQKDLAKNLGVSESTLCSYLSGKNIPDMKLVAKCIKLFNLQDKEVKELFTKYFLSTAKENSRIILDTKFFKPKRIDLLVKLLTILLLYPHDDLAEYPFEKFETKPVKTLAELNTFIGSSFNEVRYAPQPD